MKKLLSLALLLIFTITFVACDNKTTDLLTTGNTTDVTTVNPSTNNPTTNAPTTGLPTTEPVTIMPTTEAPTTAVPTTEPTTIVSSTTEEPLIYFYVAFETEGGGLFEPVEVLLGETINLPTPLKEGYEFKGWFNSEAVEYFSTTPIISDVVLYALWEQEAGYYDDYLDLSYVHGMTDGQDITVSGVVYFLTENGYYIQDNTANLFIYTDITPNVELGSRVVISGELTTYRTVKQIKNPTVVEVNLYEQDITQESLVYSTATTVLKPGSTYQVTGEVRIEGSYSTAYLYEGTKMIAEIYYESLSSSVNAIKSFVGETITVDLLYYAMGDQVPRFAYQGNSTHIKIVAIDDAEALSMDVNSLPDAKQLTGNWILGTGKYGSTYEITYVSNTLSEYVGYLGSNLTVERPSEATGDAIGYILVQISLNDEVPVTKSINVTIKAMGSTSSEVLPYYSSTVGLSGTQLLNELNRIINNGFKQLSYDDAKWVLEISDRDPLNPNNVIQVYTRLSVKGAWDYPIWNREHVWPQSYLQNSGQKADMQNLKPADVDENSKRGNLPFGYMSGSGVYEPHDDVKGDIARIILYMWTKYPGLNIDNVGSVILFKQWHQLDPVDDFERNRNEVIYLYQKNRNPYIDNPEFVDLIW
jgi:uncharacterized repeat protein (TIGR02543 family)